MEWDGKKFTDFLKRKDLLKNLEKTAIEKQHKRGKLSARERINILLDGGTFEEVDSFASPAGSSGSFSKKQSAYGDAVVTGFGKIKGRTVFIYSQDFSIMGGSLGEVHANKIAKVQDMAMNLGAPIIGLIDSGGARIQEGVASLAGYAKIFHRNVQASGVIPQISVVMGPAAGGAVYSPALTDFVFMTNHTSYMFLTGPNVVKEVLNEDVTFEDLGGAEMHTEKSGVANFVYEDDENTLMGVRKLLTYLPSNNLNNAPAANADISVNFLKNKLRHTVPDDSNKPYDVIDVINLVVDKERFFEISENFAQNLVTGYGRLNGKVIGIVANQPKILAGVIDIDASMKAARFVRFCDSFNIPLLVFEDVPGFLPGLNQEQGGIIKHGAKLLFSFSEATVPKITVVLRKAYGGAYVVMNSMNIGSDFSYAWPTAEIAVMGPEGAVAITNKKELAEAEDPIKYKKEMAAKYREEIANPYFAEERGYIDEVIDPADTREKLIRSFELLENKHVKTPDKKHTNIPL